MKCKRYTLLLTAITLISVISVVEVNAKNLKSEMELFKPSTGPPIPESIHLTWGGTVSGDINGNIYFYKVGAKVFGNNKHFWEIWVVTDDDGNMLLMGIDKGAIRLAKMTYWIKGEVANAAPEYEHLIGRTMYIRGRIITISPTEKEAPGTFKITHMARRLK